MIDFKAEKECKFTAADIYAIMDVAAQNANDNGYLNYFVYERCLLLHAIKICYPEKLDEVVAAMDSDTLGAWDKYLKDGTIEKMVNEYSDSIDTLEDIAETYFAEYQEYLMSIRAVATDFQQVVGKGAEQGNENIANLFLNKDIEEVRSIADKWGINNSVMQ